MIELGRVAGSYGVHGWIRVEPYSETLAAQRIWRIGGIRYPVEEAKAHSGTLLAKLGGLGNREQALQLKGLGVAVLREALPELAEGTYYWADLEGLEVVNAEGKVLGVVNKMFWNGAHDVMEVAGDRERLIPWVPAVVTNVDLAARAVRVEWGADW